MINKFLTADEAIALLDIQPATEVAWTSKDGTKRDDDGNAIDERETVPWVRADGPGDDTWPETLECAVANIRAAESLEACRSLRFDGWAVWYKPCNCYALRGVE